MRQNTISNNFKYLGCDISYVNQKGNEQKLAKFAEILGIQKQFQTSFGQENFENKST
jgi:hypothetical protein